MSLGAEKKLAMNHSILDELKERSGNSFANVYAGLASVAKAAQNAKSGELLDRNKVLTAVENAKKLRRK